MPDQSQTSRDGFALVGCVGCGKTAELAVVPDRRGHVYIDELHGWTASPPKCPVCSGAKEPTS